MSTVDTVGKDTVTPLQQKSTPKVAVIGTGLGGLAAAATLTARGYQVTVFDKNDWAGGKAAVLEEEGFRFDMGPTILTVPSVLKRIYSEAGLDVHDHMDLVRLDPQWRCFFDDGSVLDLQEDVEKMTQVIKDFADDQSAEGYDDFIQMSKRLHEISDNFFFWKSVEDLKDTINFKQNMSLKTLKDVLALRMGFTVGGTIRKYVPDNRVSQMLDHFVQYVGSSPFGAPAVLCSIAHMQTQEGVWYPMGGTRAVPVALKKLAEDSGAEFKLNTNVTRIKHNKGKAHGLVTEDGQEYEFDAIVSNMDAIRTYRELIGGPDAETYLKKQKKEPACSGVVLYLGLNKAYEHLAHHDFVFSKDPEQEFDDIYNKGIPARDPTCYLAAPAQTEPGVAPEGGEALYVLVHTPYIREGQDWNQIFPQYRQVILDKLKRTAGLTDIEDRIVYEAHLTPQDIHDRYKVLNGAIYGLASHGRFMGAFKPGNRSRLLDNMYLAGGAAHPGPGMPMVMMSGWIAADAVDQDMGDRKPVTPTRSSADTDLNSTSKTGKAA